MIDICFLWYFQCLQIIGILTPQQTTLYQVIYFTFYWFPQEVWLRRKIWILSIKNVEFIPVPSFAYHYIQAPLVTGAVVLIQTQLNLHVIKWNKTKVLVSLNILLTFAWLNGFAILKSMSFFLFHILRDLILFLPKVKATGLDTGCFH